jgi:hypothetical protein
MAATHHNLEQEIAILVEVIVPGRTEILRYQNWQQEDYFYDGLPYKFLNFQGGLLSDRTIGLGSGGGTVTLANADARTNSLQPVRDWLAREDGWRKARIILRQIWPNDLSAPAIEEKHSVLSSSVREDSISLALRDVLDAINGMVPSLHLTPQIAPELPMTAPGR